MKPLAYLSALLPSRRDYRDVRRTWRGDLVAGLTVGIVALPLALAFGVSSGVGAAAGLITAIVAGLVAAVFGGSNIQVSGPTGAMVVVLAPIVATQGAAVVPLVTLMAGVIVVVAGAPAFGIVVAVIVLGGRGFFHVLVFDNIDAHIGKQGKNVLDLLGGHFLRR